MFLIGNRKIVARARVIWIGTVTSWEIGVKFNGIVSNALNLSWRVISFRIIVQTSNDQRIQWKSKMNKRAWAESPKIQEWNWTKLKKGRQCHSRSCNSLINHYQSNKFEGWIWWFSHILWKMIIVFRPEEWKIWYTTRHKFFFVQIPSWNRWRESQIFVVTTPIHTNHTVRTNVWVCIS